MRAVVFREVGTPVRAEEVTPLEPGERDVVVRVGATGVCHSDLSVVNGSLGPGLPMVLGHEGAGTVEWVGPGVSRVAPGDRVIGSFVPVCGRCWYCTRGASELCERGGELGRLQRVRLDDGRHIPATSGLGTFAEAFTASEESVVAVRSELPDEQLCLIGCAITTGVGAALNTAAVVPGSSVAVFGCGGVGQAVVQGSRIAGAARIIAVDPVEMKRSASLRSGATDAVDPSATDAVAAIRELTGGRGADYTFEVIGTPETIQVAYAAARQGGTVVVVGAPPVRSAVTLPAFPLFYDEKRILGSRYGGAQVLRDFQRMIDLVETGRLDIGTMVSRRIGLDDVDSAFDAMQSGEVIRSVIVAPV